MRGEEPLRGKEIGPRSGLGGKLHRVSKCASKARPYWTLLAITVLAWNPSTVPAEERSGDLEMSPISGDPGMPRRHFRLVNPASLPPARASEIYRIVRPALQVGFAGAGTAAAYQSWRRFNSAPYLSATHGNHYLNNYVNPIGAAAYGCFENAGTLPVGTVIAKDSFTMTRSGEIVLGGLFIMEKMPAGFSHASGDWKYSYLLPDGTLFGETNGRSSNRVEYCIGCHLARAKYDHLWFIPKRYRAPG